MDEQTHNPYAAPTSLVEDVPDLVDGLELAERSTRLGAVLIDGAIGLAVTFPVMYLSNFWARAMAQQIGPAELIAWAIGGFVVFCAIHGYPLHHNGQTWGKRALKIRIVDLDGRKPDLVRLIGLRYAPVQFCNQVPYVGPLIGLVDSLMIFRADRRCLHDLIAGTRVVKFPVAPRAAS